MRAFDVGGATQMGLARRLARPRGVGCRWVGPDGVFHVYKREERETWRPQSPSGGFESL